MYAEKVFIPVKERKYMQGSAHWKDRAIAKSEAITDLWEVAKIYAARAAEWVLFGCMVVNIVEILPGVAISPLMVNIATKANLG